MITITNCQHCGKKLKHVKFTSEECSYIESALVEYKTKAQVLEGLVQCHSDGMAWEIISNPAKSGRESLSLFSLHDGDAIRRVVLYKGDQLFVGRAKQ